MRAADNTPYEYTGLTTDPNGNFTVSVTGLAAGNYSWRVKGPNDITGGNSTPPPGIPGWLANSGTLTLTGGAISTAEMGLMRAGDCNNDNVVTISDFGILRNTFGRMSTDPGYDGRADFNGDNVITISDYNLLRGNFGVLGADPIGPQGAPKGDKPAGDYPVGPDKAGTGGGNK